MLTWKSLEWIIPIVLVLIIVIRVKVRGFFWKARDGTQLTFKQFMKRWKDGVEGITPLQQTKTTLWSYPLVIGGILSGLIIMGLRGEWWLVLILGGSLPMTLMGILSTWQKFKQQKRIHETMKEIERKEKEFGGEYTDEDAKRDGYIDEEGNWIENEKTE
jgi:hypothetical protein